MTVPRSRRPWLRRKRTWAVVGLWLPLLYVASSGPVMYGFDRDWLPGWFAGAFLPSHRVMRALPDPVAETWYGYVEWWGLLAIRHAAD